VSDSDQVAAPLPEGFQVQSVIAPKIPPETSFPLRREQFQNICDGSSGEDRTGRGFYLGVLLSAGIGLLGLVGSADLTNFNLRKNWPFVLSFLVLFGLLLLAAGSAYVYDKKLRAESTPYTRLKKTISDFFERQSPPEMPLERSSQVPQKPPEKEML
jgi:hypothetical protein